MSKVSSCFAEILAAKSSAYRESQVLFTSVRLGLFAQLGKESMTATQLAEGLAANPRAVRILGDALVSLGLLKKKGDQYSNLPEALDYLLPDGAFSQDGLLWHGASLYEKWGHLLEVVKTGRPVACNCIAPQLRGTETSFARAMASSARLGARETAEKFPLTHARRLLDVGGGPGLYAIEFARHNPHLQVTIMDTPETLRAAREHIGKTEVARRIRFKPGDMLKDDLGTRYDAILISNVIHMFSPEQISRLLTRAVKALRGGGYLLIKDFLLQADRSGPAWVNLFAVNMLVSTEGGDCYSLAEIREFFRMAGLVYEKAISLLPHSHLVVASKPCKPTNRNKKNVK